IRPRDSLMALLSLQDATLAFGGPTLLDRTGMTVDRGERVSLLGRNGAGKSTVLRLLGGALAPTSGELVRQTGITLARLDQEVPEGISGTLFEVVAAGLGATGRLLSRYHEVSHRLQLESSDATLRELGRLHEALDSANAWQIHSRVETALQHLELDPDASFANASGGQKRQALLARALVSEPDVLLLDEPTNHLDVAAVEWLESFVIERNITLVFVTHDRAFLRRVATRIVELDRGRLTDWGTGYDGYLARKEASLATEEREWALFDKKLAQEEVWIRTGIQARRTRNEGRVRALETLRLERAARRDRLGQINLRADEAERSGRLVVEAKRISLAFGARAIVKNLSTTILRGSRIGLIGPNGSGKTTLLKLLLGQLLPDDGSVRLGTNLEVAYFDQLREQLDVERTVLDNISAGTEYIEIGGTRKHVMGYLQDFLFSPERARTLVRVLSGGERNRLLLARLFTRSFNLLVLDEPTNDLDIETLELLETMLLEFKGTLLLVSHDRAFLDNVVTSTLVFEGHGIINEYVGGYTDWLRQRPPAINANQATAARPAKVPPRAPRARRLSFKEKTELANLPDRIEAAERERNELYRARLTRRSFAMARRWREARPGSLRSVTRSRSSQPAGRSWNPQRPDDGSPHRWSRAHRPGTRSLAGAFRRRGSHHRQDCRTGNHIACPRGPGSHARVLSPA
ncbi:MAG: ATP-binding cassette domain-containing protein, partial [Gemmatimonadales bacterium]